MSNKIWRLTMPLTIGFSLMWLVIAFAQEPFYKGKTIRIIVGFSAGGGFDTYARSVARHIGKQIPGNPTIVVENMAGAGSVSPRVMDTKQSQTTDCSN